VVSAFVLLKHGHARSDDLHKALLDTVRRELGPVAVIGELNFVSMLPKTRSGKIMRRLLKDIAEGRTLGDTTTLADPAVVDRLKSQYEADET